MSMCMLYCFPVEQYQLDGRQNTIAWMMIFCSGELLFTQGGKKTHPLPMRLTLTPEAS